MTCVDPREPDALPKLLSSSPVPGAVLIPCTDPWALATARLEPSLSARFPSSSPPACALEQLAFKAPFAETLAQLSIPQPHTTILRTPADLDTVADEVLARSFLKPSDSYSFQVRFGRKAFWAVNRGEARARLEQVLAAGLTVMLQEYVPGPPTAHYFVDGFVDRGGTPRAFFVRQRIRMWGPDFGNSSFMLSVPAETAAPAIDALCRLLIATEYRGIFSAEFKRDSRDGSFRMIEVNSRVWKFVDFAVRCGVDVCTMAYDDAEERPVASVAGYDLGAGCVDPYFDLRACLAQYKRGELSLGAWASSWLRSSQPVHSWSDPLPEALLWLDRLRQTARGRLDH